MRARRAATLAFALAAAEASGDKAAPAKEGDLRAGTEARIRLRERVRAEAGVAQPAEAPRPATIDFEAERTRRALIEANEREMARRRREMIALIDQMLADPRYPARYQRLFQRAELWWEEAKYRQFLALRAWEAGAESAAARGAAPPPPPEADFSAAIADYRQILADKRDFERIDEVRYHLGYALSQAGDPDGAVAVLAELVRARPDSPLAPEAHLAMAEIHFEAGRLADAEHGYRAVLDRHAAADVAPYARYKLAWTYVNAGDLPAAERELAAVAAAGARHAGLDLRAQALADLLAVYAELPDGPTRARAAYARLDPDRVPDHLMRLARVLGARDRAAGALAVLDGVAADLALSPRLPEAHALRVEVLKRGGDLDRLGRELGALADAYAPDAAWSRRHAGDAAARARARALVEESLEFLAVYRHEEAQRSGDAALYRAAAGAYREFLARYSDSPRAARVRYHLGEALSHLGEHVEAAEAYRGAAASDQEFARDAAYKRVYALSAALRGQGLDPEARIVEEGRDLPETPLSELESAFVQACDAFATRHADSQDAGAVLLAAAKALYLRGALREAAGYGARVLAIDPDHPNAAFAGALALDCHNRLRDWPEMVRWARHLLARGNFAHRSRAELREIVAAASVNAVQVLEARGDLAGAAEAMLAVAEEFPRSAEAPRALYNAGAFRERAGDRAGAEALWRRVIEHHPQSPLAADAAFALGALAEARADFAAAAAAYGALARMPAGERTAPALLRAARLHEALGAIDDAVAARRAWLDRFPASPQAAEVALDAAAALDRAGRKREATAALRGWLRRYGGADLARAMQAHLLLGDPRGALDRYRKAGSAPAAAPGTPAASAAARARFALAEAHLAEMEAVTLALPEARMARELDRKSALLDRAVAAYLAVAALGDPEYGAAAAYRIGAAYRHLADALLAAPVPADLSEQEQEVYRAELQTRALPLEDAAAEAFSKAVALAHQRRVYNAWTERSARELGRVRPAAAPLPGPPSVRVEHAAE